MTIDTPGRAVARGAGEDEGPSLYRSSCSRICGTAAAATPGARAEKREGLGEPREPSLYRSRSHRICDWRKV